MTALPAPLPDAAPTLRVLRSYLRLPPEPGGMEAHIARLSAAQRAQGVEVVNLFQSGACDGPHIRLLPGRAPGRSASLRSLRFYAAAWAAAPRLRVLGAPGVVHVHGSFADFFGGRALARRLGASLLAGSVHGTVIPAHAGLYRRSLAAYDLVLATGKSEQEGLEDLLGRPVHHVPSAVSDLFLQPGPAMGAADVITVANLLPVKGLDLLLDCAARRPALRFALIGDGPQRPALERRIAAAGLRNLDLLGSLPAPEVAARLRGARVFLSTSRTEGTPTAALEAMAAGLPVVLTPSNRYDWLVAPGVNGWVTAGFDPGEIAARLDDALASEERRRAMGEANRRKLRGHGWEATAARVTALMLEALETRA